MNGYTGILKLGFNIFISRKEIKSKNDYVHITFEGNTKPNSNIYLALEHFN